MPEKAFPNLNPNLKVDRRWMMEENQTICKFVKQIVNKRNLINIPSEESLRLSVTLNNTEYLKCWLMLHYISKP